MAQLQKVSWRTVGYAALGTAVAAASVVAIINRDGVRPTSLSSSSAARWLVDQINHRVVLVDGLAGRVVAKIQTDSDSSDEVAVQGAGGAFLITPTKASVRTISTAKLQLGTAQTVATLFEQDVKYGVGESGLTIVDAASREARVVAVDDVTRKINIPTSTSAQVAADGSMWLLSATQATHVNVDETSTTTPLRSPGNQTTTIGSRAVSYDANNRVLHWLGGGDVSVASLPNASEAILQEPGDDAPCVWMASDDTLACVGPTGIDTTKLIASMHAGSTDTLGIAGSAAVLISTTNEIDRIDLENQRLAPLSERPPVAGVGKLTVTAAGDLVWIDEQSGEHAWVVQRFGINSINKADKSAPEYDAQGQVQTGGDGGVGQEPGNGIAQGDPSTVHPDPRPGVEDPPVAVDDSVTARAGTTITIPVTSNDYDPDGDAIAVKSAGDPKSAGHGVTDVLNGTSVSYVPEPGYSGTDSFSYTIVDQNGLTDSATVNIQLFPADSPNRPPIARADTARTRIGRPVTIDVLNNDIDPERDLLSIATIGQSNSSATITDTKGPTQLAALLFTPPPGLAGTFRFTYQAADPQGGLSEKTPVTVEVLDANTENQPPDAQPDSIRLRVGVGQLLDVRANDTDPDGDELTIDVKDPPRGVSVVKRAQQLFITLQPGAADLSLIQYTLHDGIPTHDKTGLVLAVKIPDQADNRPPVANPDAERVVIGNTVRIPVTSNDVDPDGDKITLLSVNQPLNGVGLAVGENNAVRFTPNLPDITQPTPVSFTYRIGDGHSHEAVGTVNVTVLAEPVPRAPFARDDFADTVVDKPVNIDVLTNDSDPSGGLPTLVGDASCPNGGTAIATDKQRIEFTPPAGLQGTFRCRYRVINPQGLTAEASIIVTVTAALPGNRDPVIDDTLTTVEVNVGQAPRTFNANLLATDADGDSLVFSSVGKVEHGSISFNPKSATFTYTPPVIGTPDHTPTDDSIAITISDGNNGSTSGTIAVRIFDPDTTPATTPPSVRDIPLSAVVGVPLAFDIVAELQPSNANATLKLDSAQADTPSPAATVTKSGGGVVVTATESGQLNITYTVSNATGQTNSAKLRLSISDPPVVNPTPVAVDDALTVSSSGSGSVDLVRNDRNISDPGDVAQVTLVNRPPVSFGTVTLQNNTLVFVAAQSSLGGTATIQYTVTDGTSVSNQADIVLTVEACAASPVSVRPGFEFTPYMTPINIDLSKYVDSGTIIPESVQGAGLTGPVGTYTPPSGMNGVEQVTYTVTNACGDQVQGVLQIDVNRAPVGGGISQNLSRGDTLSLTVDQVASDDEPLQFASLSGNPPWVGIADPATIVASPPLNLPSGTYAFTATVRDPGGLTAIASISLTVSNQPPTAVADAYFTGLSQLTFDPTVNDFDSEPGPLDIQAVSVLDGPGAVLDVSSPFVTVSLGHGVSTFRYTITDSGGLTDSSTITITSNHSPTMPGVTDSSTKGTVAFNLLPTDPDDDPVSVDCPNSTPNLKSIVTVPNPNPSNPAEVNRVNVTVFADDGFQGTTSFTCDAVDSFGAKDTATITLTFTD